jgi:hypothetical protein
MYPDRELTLLAAHKAFLRQGIALRRAQCRAAAAQVARPVAWLDRVMAFWRHLSPFTQFAAVPLGWLVTRTVLPRMKILRTLARWGPLVFSAVRGIRSATRARAASAAASEHGH